MEDAVDVGKRTECNDIDGCWTYVHEGVFINLSLHWVNATVGFYIYWG